MRRSIALLPVVVLLSAGNVRANSIVRIDPDQSQRFPGGRRRRYDRHRLDRRWHVGGHRGWTLAMGCRPRKPGHRSGGYARSGIDQSGAGAGARALSGFVRRLRQHRRRRWNQGCGLQLRQLHRNDHDAGKSCLGSPYLHARRRCGRSYDDLLRFAEHGILRRDGRRRQSSRPRASIPAATWRGTGGDGSERRATDQKSVQPGEPLLGRGASSRRRAAPRGAVSR